MISNSQSGKTSIELSLGKSDGSGKAEEKQAVASTSLTLKEIKPVSTALLLPPARNFTLFRLQGPYDDYSDSGVKGGQYCELDIFPKEGFVEPNIEPLKQYLSYYRLTADHLVSEKFSTHSIRIGGMTAQYARFKLILAIERFLKTPAGSEIDVDSCMVELFKGKSVCASLIDKFIDQYLVTHPRGFWDFFRHDSFSDLSQLHHEVIQAREDNYLPVLKKWQKSLDEECKKFLDDLIKVVESDLATDPSKQITPKDLMPTCGSAAACVAHR